MPPHSPVPTPPEVPTRLRAILATLASSSQLRQAASQYPHIRLPQLPTASSKRLLRPFSPSAVRRRQAPSQPPHLRHAHPTQSAQILQEAHKASNLLARLANLVKHGVTIASPGKQVWTLNGFHACVWRCSQKPAESESMFNELLRTSGCLERRGMKLRT